MKTTLKSIQIKYQKLVGQLAQSGWIARGNTYRRFLIRKVDDKDKKCGPYFILTRKQAGRTVTHALNRQQFDLYVQAIARQKKIDLILKQMRKLSVRYIHLSTPQLPSRKRAKKPS